MGDKECLELVGLKLAIMSEAAAGAPPPPPPPSSFILQQFFTLPPPPPPSLHPTPSSQQSFTTNPANSSPRNSRKVGAACPKYPSRTRRPPMNILRQGKSETIPAPYPWATDKRAKVRSVKDLLSDGIEIISGEVQCKRCDRKFQIEYDLDEKYYEVDTFLAKNMDNMHDRAPSSWMCPKLPNCKFCGQNNCAKPVIDKKKSINWLFLFLGELLGCCKLAQLKYFCKHANHHRTGAKDRVLFLTYAGLRKQLQS